MLGNEYSNNELIFGSLFILVIFYFSSSYNINLLQFTLIIITIISIIYISIQKNNDIKNLQITTKITTTEKKPLLVFIDKISYFKLYNPPVYDSFILKINNYMKLKEFIYVHNKNNYKLYPKKILQENLMFQQKDILETFMSFEHTLDDRIISTYKLHDLTNELKKLL